MSMSMSMSLWIGNPVGLHSHKKVVFSRDTHVGTTLIGPKNSLVAHKELGGSTRTQAQLAEGRRDSAGIACGLESLHACTTWCGLARGSATDSREQLARQASTMAHEMTNGFDGDTRTDRRLRRRHTQRQIALTKRRMEGLGPWNPCKPSSSSLKKKEKEKTLIGNPSHRRDQSEPPQAAATRRASVEQPSATRMKRSPTRASPAACRVVLHGPSRFNPDLGTSLRGRRVFLLLELVEQISRYDSSDSTGFSQPDCLSASSGYAANQFILGVPLGHRKPDFVPTGSHVARVRERASRGRGKGKGKLASDQK
ncbi:hypothetical protein E6C27_scaffold142G00010 [Cucumis melo var. makuwa]|uniref:Uncharacterized protein n=1 Tax=Cucumis melo var. makuwa TaxID=1194695 RepID=A0A5A7SRC1_CUCMM|nr:hypothetical protein E6C27_scaffold142G00010 [Cucumis melo var. makuwa]